jgi:hypothetical protein
VIDLDRALADLAEHLDHAPGDQLADSVRRRIALSAPLSARRRARDRTRSFVAAAAVLLLMVVAALALSPARHAIANWLGVGAVEVRHTDVLPGTGTSSETVPGSPGGTKSQDRAARELAAARQAVDFTIATPRGATVGEVSNVDLDLRVPGGLVALDYARFSLVEVPSFPTQPEPISKLISPATRVESVQVDGNAGLWITGAHSVGYLDRTGRLERETVRRSGPVLIWEHAGVTYRIEGLAVLAAAQQVADSIR